MPLLGYFSVVTEEIAHSGQTGQESPLEPIHSELVAAAPAATVLGDPGLPAEERVAQAFLVRHPPGTRAVYRRALRHWAAWCAAHELPPLQARREHVERWLREQEEGRAAAAASTRAGRLAAVGGFYEVAVDEQLVIRNPAARVRRPRLDDDSQRLGVDRTEGTDLLAAAQAAVTAAGDAPVRPASQAKERRRAGLRRAHRDHLLACLLLLNGLRISEALGLDVEDLGTMRSHRVARVRRKGGRHQDVVLAPRTAGALDDYLESRGNAPTSGPLLVTRSGERLDRWAAQKVITRLGRAAKIAHPVYPHALRHGFVTAALDAGVPLHRVQDAAGHRDPRTTRRYDRARGALDNHAAYVVGAYFA
jgi:integrase/recombinase XerD